LRLATVDASTRIALPVGVLQIDLERGPDEPRPVKVTLGLLRIRQVVASHRDVVGEDARTFRAAPSENFSPEPHVSSS